MAVNFQPLYILAAGGERAFNQLDVVSNNLANVDTPGFKKLVLEEMAQGVPQNPDSAKDLFVFPRFKDTPVITTQGHLQKTDRPLDVAIQGDGYFTVKIKNKTVLTRNGHFFINQNGILVDVNGHPVLGENGKPIVINTQKPTNITIASDGNIYQGRQKVGKLLIKNYENIKPLGDSYYESKEKEKPAKFTLLQGFLEGSNVNPIKSMVELINAQRRMEIYGSMMKGLDTIEQKTTEIGRV